MGFFELMRGGDLKFNSVLLDHQKNWQGANTYNEYIANIVSSGQIFVATTCGGLLRYSNIFCNICTRKKVDLNDYFGVHGV